MPLFAHKLRTPAAARVLFATVLLALLAACQGMDVQPANPPDYDYKDQRQRDRYGTVTGEDGLTIFSTGRRAGSRDREADATSGIGVNAYLWRGTLDTIDFIPLASADPFGGLIITDWYRSSNTPNERLKLHVLIKDQALRADALDVSVFRQIQGENGEGWLDAPSDPATARELEDRILTRAREIRLAQLEAER